MVSIVVCSVHRSVFVPWLLKPRARRGWSVVRRTVARGKYASAGYRCCSPPCRYSPDLPPARLPEPRRHTERVRARRRIDRQDGDALARPQARRVMLTLSWLLAESDDNVRSRPFLIANLVRTRPPRLSPLPPVARVPAARAWTRGWRGDHLRLRGLQNLCHEPEWRSACSSSTSSGSRSSSAWNHRCSTSRPGAS